MFIDIERKFIFFHNRKCAGSSMRTLFNDFARKAYGKSTWELMTQFFVNKGLPHVPRDQNFVKHMNYNMLVSLLPNEDWGQYTKFCFVRNPYTWYYSLWLQYSGQRSIAAVQGIVDQARGDFTQFVKHAHQYYWFAWNNHLDYTHYDGKQAMDFVGKLETLDQDLQTICKKIDVPYVDIHQNKKGDNDYLKFYTAETIQLVNDSNHKAFVTYGYEKLDPNGFRK